MSKETGSCRWLLAVAVSLVCAAAPLAAQEKACDRQCMESLVNQTLVSMTKHDASLVPLARKYKMTLNNVPSGLSMATPWRTIMSFTKLGLGQYVIDVPRQEVFFIATVEEGDMPATLCGRLKAEDTKISELELYLGRSKMDSGMQFAPGDISKLPAVWSTPIPSGAKRATRQELTKIGMGDNSPITGSAEGCLMAENGHVVSDYLSVDAFMHMAPNAPKEAIEEIRKKNEAAQGGPITFGCDPDGAMQADKSRRVIVDEDQGLVVTLAIVNGMVVPNFLPPPGPSPEYPTAFVPDFATDDLAWRMEVAHNPPAASKDSSAEPMPASLSVALILKFYDAKIQGFDRFMQAQPVGGGSPWELKSK